MNYNTINKQQRKLISAINSKPYGNLNMSL